jgi:hypothetical protein
MKKHTFPLLILIFSALFILDTGSITGSEPSPLGKKNSKLKLFNGKNLDGWYTFIKDRGRDVDPLRVFTVDKGLIRISGEEYGCITTEEEFENYRLLVEFKWGQTTFNPRIDKARDSGVLLHSVGEDGGYSGIWMHSLECQIIEGGTGDLLVVGDGSKNFHITCPVDDQKQGSSHVFNPDGKTVTINGGRINWFGRDPDWKDIKGFRGRQDIEKPVGKWNRIECIVNDNEITVFLNGVLVNKAVDVKPKKGKIQIQSEGAEIFFRRIELTSL